MSSAAFRAKSKRQGVNFLTPTSAPSSMSRSAVPSSLPVSSTDTPSASAHEAMNRSQNCRSFLDIAYTQIFKGFTPYFLPTQYSVMFVSPLPPTLRSVSVIVFPSRLSSPDM